MKRNTDNKSLDGILDINKLESLEFSLGQNKFPKFIYEFINDITFDAEEYVSFCREEDFAKLRIICESKKLECEKVGAIVLYHKLAKLQAACLDKNIDLSVCIKELKDILNKTIIAIRDILMISFCLYLSRKCNNYS